MGPLGWELISYGTVPSTVLNAAIAALTAGGKIVLAFNTTWILTAALVDNGVDDITISGMGKSTVLRIADGADINAIELTTVSGWILEDFKVDGNSANQTVNQHLVSLHTCTDCRVQRLWVTDAKDVNPDDAANIYLFDPLYCVVSDCTVWASETNGIIAETTAAATLIRTMFHNNTVYSNDGPGIANDIGKGLIISDNTCHLNRYGISVQGYQILVANNICTNSIHSNITVMGQSLSVIANFCDVTDTYYGIWLSGSRALVASNTVLNSNGSGILIAGSGDEGIITGNKLGSNGAYGIELQAGADNVRVVFNHYRNNASGPILDGGINTLFESTPIWFVAPAVQLLDAAGAPKGYEIDLAAEYALGFAEMPRHAYRSVKIRIFGTSLAIAPGAGNGMMLDAVIESGVSGEDYAAETIAVLKACEEDNPAQNSRITWEYTLVDDVDVDDLVGDDRVEVRLLYNDAVGGDVATDVAITGGEIQFV